MNSIKKPVGLVLTAFVLLTCCFSCKGSGDKNPAIVSGTVELTDKPSGTSGENTGTSEKHEASASEIEDIRSRTATESWAYIHDKSKEILRLNDDGTAYYVSKVYENGKQVNKENVYSSYIKEDEYITLKDSNGEELKIRYAMKDKELLMYERIIYGLSTKDQKEKKGLIGAWTNIQNEKMFFQFSETGTFLEDGIFSGNFKVNEDAGSISLDYADPYSEDIEIYYALADNILIVDYPWQMVPTETEPAEK